MKPKRLRKKYFNALCDLANWSQEIFIESSIGKNGVSCLDFRNFLPAYARFLRMFPENPRDLLTK